MCNRNSKIPQEWKKFHQTVGNGEDVIRAIIGTIGDANAALVVPAAAEVLHDVQDCRGGCGLDGEIVAIARVPGKCLLDPCVIVTDARLRDRRVLDTGWQSTVSFPP